MERFFAKHINLNTLGYVTSIFILPSDEHGDPQVLLGYSLGHILNFRIRANFYYPKKVRQILSPIDVSQFASYPGRMYFYS